MELVAQSIFCSYMPQETLFEGQTLIWRCFFGVSFAVIRGNILLSMDCIPIAPGINYFDTVHKEKLQKHNYLVQDYPSVQTIPTTS